MWNLTDASAHISTVVALRRSMSVKADSVDQPRRLQLRSLGESPKPLPATRVAGILVAMRVKWTMVVRLFLLLVLLVCHAAGQTSQQSGEASKNSLPEQTSEPPRKQILNKDQTEILVFESCSAGNKHEACPVEVVYTLSHQLSESVLQVFNQLTVNAEFSLPDLSEGRHVTILPHAFYWQEHEETLPDPMFFCNLAASVTTDGVSHLWDAPSEASACDYRPDPSDQVNGVQYDQAGQFRGTEVGISSFLYPSKQNFERRVRGNLPEVEILGAGFVERHERAVLKRGESDAALFDPVTRPTCGFQRLL